MKLFIRFFLFSFLIFFSCQDENEARRIQQQKEIAKKEEVAKRIHSAWNFRTVSLSPLASNFTNDWAEWRLFQTELYQKPTNSLTAFQKKSKMLTKKADEVLQTIPGILFRPEFKTRFTVLLNKFRSIEMYLNLSEIPEKKVIGLISEINLELLSIESQMNELARKNQIPMEQGEADMIRMLDTSRAVKEIPKKLD
jgi:hypothetical protein